METVFQNLGDINKWAGPEKLDCGAGYRGLCITPTGGLKLCQMSPSWLNIGFLSEQPIDDILTKLPSVDFMQLSSPKSEVCGNCQHFQFCASCIVRGLIRAKENPDNCTWFKTMLPNHIKEWLLTLTGGILS
jgi:radical SAM protein with 4Fe4S-binding SPASM domain